MIRNLKVFKAWIYCVHMEFRYQILTWFSHLKEKEYPNDFFWGELNENYLYFDLDLFIKVHLPFLDYLKLRRKNEKRV